MLKNYLKISFRNILRNKTTSFIGITGFSVGFLVLIFIYLFIRNEFSYDSFHKDYEKIFSVTVESSGNKYGCIPPVFTEIAENSFPQIEQSVKVLSRLSEIKLNKDVYKDNVIYTEPHYFKIFSNQVIAGNINSFKQSPVSVVLTRSAAKKYFGDSSPVGKTLSIKLENNLKDFIVGAIIKDYPDNSSLKLSIIIPYQNAENISWIKNAKGDWASNEFFPYYFVKLKNVDDRKFIESKIPSLIPGEVKQRFGKMEYNLTPLSQLHFSNDVKYPSINTAKIETPIILCIIGLLILIIISLNFVNLSIARSSHRFKEMGIRKIMGAGKQKISLQFLTESTIMVLLSFLLSIILSIFSLPSFNSITNKELELNQLFSVAPLLQIAIIIFLVGFLSGIYPAIILSRFNPVKILKGEQKLSGSKFLSKAFITIQFTVSIFLLSIAVIINLQYGFMTRRNPGFEKENTIILKTNEFFGRHLNNGTETVFKEELLQNPVIKSVSSSNMILGGDERQVPQFRFDYYNKNIVSYIFDFDRHGKETVGLKLKQGRFFNDEDSPESCRSIIINESFAKAMRIKNPLNEIVLLNSFSKKTMTVIGVVEDFNYKSLKEKIEPTVFCLRSGRSMSEAIYIKYHNGDAKQVIEILKKTWRKYFPSVSLEYSFLDNRIESMYKEEKQWKNIINFASVTAVVFACIGLFGLILFSVEKRTKEIGVRKVLGASVADILKLVLNEFAILIVLAIMSSIPLAYYLGEKWLEDFAYRIEISWWIFVLSGGIALLIAIITVSFQAIKAALINPVESLRYE